MKRNAFFDNEAPSQISQLSPISMPSPRQVSGNLNSGNLVQNHSEKQLDTINKKQEKVKVYVRLRPFLEEEYSQSKQCSIESFDTKNKIIAIKRDYEKKVFNFDGIFEPKISQKDIYNQVAQPVIQSVLQGFNGTIFAYGQTGTGKTFTMLGGSKETDKGIIPRGLQDIFTKVEEDTNYIYSIQMSCIQIYMEMLQDLINPENQVIRIRESPENGVFVSGIEWVIIQNPSEALQLLDFAEKNRAVAFTALNACSSRSHVILMVQVQKRSKKVIEEQSKCNSLNNSLVQYNTNSFIQNEDPDNVLNQNNNSNAGVSLVTSILYMVDLAGSERVKKSKSTGDRLHEAKAINSSLSALGKCISALSDGKSNFIPFRESKLTRLLQDSLGGNSKTSLVVTIGPSIKHTDETISSLGFGQRAMKVTNKPIVNKQKDYYLLSMQLQQELDGKDDQIHQLEISQQQMMKKIMDLQTELNRIKLDKQELEGSSRHLKMSLCQGVKQEDAIQFLEQQKKIEVDNIEKKYQELLRKTEDEHKSFLEEIDKTMLEQEEEIDLLKQENTKCQTDIENYLKQIDSLTDQLKAKNDEISTFENTYKLLENEKESSEQQFIELSQQFKLLDQGYKERDENNKKQLKLVEQKVIQKEKELQQLKEELLASQSGQTEEFKNLQEELNGLKQKDEELQKELTQKIELFAEKENKHKEELEIVKNEYTSQFEYLNTERDNLKNVLESGKTELELELKQAKEQIEKQRVEIVDYERVINESNEEKSLMMQQLEIKIDELIQHNKREIASMKKQISEKDQFIQNQKNSYEQLLNKFNELQEDFEENQEQFTEEQEKYQKDLSEKESQINEIQQKLDDQKIQKENEDGEYQVQIEKLNEKIQSLIEQKQQLETQFESDIEQYKSKNQQDLENVNIKFAQSQLQNEAILKQLNSQIDQLNQNNSQKEQQLAKLQDQAEKLNEQIASLTNELQEQSNELELLQQNNKELILQLNEAEQELAQLKQELKNEAQSNTDLKKEISILNEEIFDKKKDLENFTKVTNQLEQKIEQLTSEIAVKDIQLENEKQDNKEIMEENDNQIKIKEAELLRVIEQQQSEKKEIELKIITSTNEKIELEQKIQELLSVQENSEQIIAQKEEFILDLENKLSEKNEKLKQVSQLSSEIEEALQIKQEHIQQLLLKNTQIDNQITLLKDQILDLEEINKENIEKQEELLNEIEENKQQIEKLKFELVESKEQSREFEEQITTQQTEINNYQSQISKLEEQNEQTSKELTESSEQINFANEEIKSLQENNETLSNNVSELTLKLQELTEQLESQSTANQQLTEKVKDIVQKAQDYQKMIKDQNEEINTTAEANIEIQNQLRSEIENLSNQVLEYEQEINDLKEQLEIQMKLIQDSESTSQNQQLEIEQKVAQMIEQENLVKQFQLKAQLGEERIVILEQQLQSKQQVIEQQIDEIKKHKENVEQVLQAEINDKQSIINEYQEKFIEQENLQKELEEQIEQIINEYQVKLDAKQSEIEELHNEFQQYQQESNEQFNQASTQYEEQVAQQKEEIESLKQNISVESKSKEESQRVNEDLQIELNQIKNEFALKEEELEKQLVQEKEYVDQLNTQLEKIQQNLEEINHQKALSDATSNQKLDQMKLDIQEKVSLIDAQSQQLSAMIIQKTFKRVQKQKLCKLYLSALISKSELIKNQISKINETEKLNNKQYNELLNQAELTTHLQQQIEMLNGEKEKLNFICNQKDQELLSQESEKKRLYIEKESDQQQMNVYIDKISLLNQELASKDQQLSESIESLSDLSQQLRECTTSIDDLQSSLKTIKSQQVHDNIDYKVRKIQLTFQKHILRKELNNVFNKNEELQQNIDDLIQKNSNLQFQNEELQIQNRQIQDQVQDEQNRNVELDLELREKNGYIEKISQMIEKREKNLNEFEKKVNNLEQLQKENQIIINQQHQQLEESNFKLKIMRSIIIITKFITSKKWQTTTKSLLKAFINNKLSLNEEIKYHQERAAGYQIARLLKQKVLEQKISYFGRMVEERQNTVEMLQSSVEKEQYIFRKASQVYEREVSARKIQSAYRLFKVNQIICAYKQKLDNFRRINFDYKEKIDRLQEQLYDLEDEIEKEKNIINTHNEQFSNEKGILQENMNLLNTEFKKVINQRDDRENQISSLQKSEKTLKQRLKELDQKWREQYQLLENKHIDIQKEKKILTESYDQTLAIINKDKALLIEYQNQLELSRQQDKAARFIQGFIKDRKRQDEQEKLKKEKEDLSKIFKQKNAQTGQYLLQQSLKNVNQIFSNLIQNFTSNNNQ